MPAPAPPPPPDRRRRPAAAGPRLRTYARFHSRLFRDSRDLVVWTPPGYGDPRRRHPVVYFLDGERALAAAAWDAGAAALRLVRRGRIAPPILVGIGPAGRPRADEFTPTRADYARPDGTKMRSAGDAKRYARFVVQELKPFIDARYLTLPGPRTTALVGAGLGGLAALYFALWHPRVFGRVAALSPALEWDDRLALRDFARVRHPHGVQLWVEAGTAEPGWEVIQPFRDTLVAAGWTLGADLAYREVAGADAGDRALAARLPEVLEFLVGRARP